jgi:prepilin-type N-terminal cleavage/methylation domain-containing protein
MKRPNVQTSQRPNVTAERPCRAQQGTGRFTVYGSRLTKSLRFTVDGLRFCKTVNREPYTDNRQPTTVNRQPITDRHTARSRSKPILTFRRLDVLTFRRGFSLIETIAAIVILAVAVPAMLWTVSDAHRQRVDPVLTSRATWLATEMLEDIIADRHSQTRGWSHVVGANYPTESPVADFTGFSRSVAIAETGPDLQSAGSGYKTVTVTIQWTGSRGQTQSMQIATVLTEY